MLLTVVAVCALVLAYVAVVGSWLALRTLGRVRRASQILGAALPAASGDPRRARSSLLEATARHAELAEQVAGRLDEVQAELDATRRSAAARTRTGQRDTDSALEAIRSDVATALRRVALVRYDAFGDHGGRLSFSLALLDDTGNGVTLTSIAGRTENRLYAKGVRDGAGDRELSPEEDQAVRAALRQAPEDRLNAAS